MKSQTIRFTCLLTALLWRWALPAAAPPVESTEVRSFPTTPGDTLIVENPYGRIRLRAWDQDRIEIRIRSVAEDASRFADINVVSEKIGTRIFLQSYFFDYSSESVLFDISAPRYLNAWLSGANPAIEIEGLNGYVHAQTLTGFISARNLGSSISLFSQEGSLEYTARTQPNGDIHLESATGHVTCRLNRGLNLQTRVRGGRALIWDQSPQPTSQALQKQLGHGGPLLLATSQAGTLEVELTEVSGATPTGHPVAH